MAEPRSVDLQRAEMMAAPAATWYRDLQPYSAAVYPRASSGFQRSDASDALDAQFGRALRAHLAGASKDELLHMIVHRELEGLHNRPVDPIMRDLPLAAKQTFVDSLSDTKLQDLAQRKARKRLE